MSPDARVGLPEALERAAAALPDLADAIRPANGDPARLFAELGAAQAAQVLAWLLAQQPADAEELVEAWVELGAAGTGVITAVDPAGLGKAGRKILSRAQHRMRSRGLAPSAPEAPSPPRAARLPRSESASEWALLSPLDPNGGRIVFLATPHPAGGIRLFEIRLHAREGIVGCRAVETGRSKARRFFEELQRPDALAAVEAPPAALRSLVAAAAALASPDRPLLREFCEWRARIGAPAPGDQRPGEMVRNALGSAPLRREALTAGIAQRYWGPWLAGEPEAEAALARLRALHGIERGAPELAALIDEAVRNSDRTDLAERWADGFEESAYVHWRQGRVETARDALAAAAALRRGGEEAASVRRVLFDGFFENQIDALAGPRSASGEETR